MQPNRLHSLLLCVFVLCLGKHTYAQREPELLKMYYDSVQTYTFSNAAKTMLYATKAQHLLNRSAVKSAISKDSIAALQTSIYNKLGICHYLNGNIDSSLHFYKLALDLSTTRRDTMDMIRNVNNIAVAYIKNSQYNKAIEFYLQGLSLSEQLKNKKMIANFCNNLSAFYQEGEAKDSIKAMKYRKRSLQLSIETGDKKQEANNYANLATMLQFVLPDSALEYINKAIEIYIETEEPRHLAQGYSIKARIYELKKHLHEAAEYYKQAQSIVEKIGDNTLYVRETNSLAKVLMAIADSSSNKNILLNEAQANLQKSIKICEKHGLKNELAAALQSLSLIDEHYGDYKNAFQRFYKAKTIIDSIKEQSQLEAAYKLESRYVDERNQRLVEEQKANEEIMRQRGNIIKIVGFGSILLILLLVLLYKRMLLVSQQRDAIALQKETIEDQRKEILSSINYARSLQEAVLPNEPTFTDGRSMFVLYIPRDIVSGDFYYFYERDNTLLLVVADCTGHGVPGACLSMLGISYMRELSLSHFDRTPAEMLDAARDMVIKDLGQTGSVSEQHDGMDISICKIDKSTNTIQFASAHNPLFVVPANGEPFSLKGDRQPVSYYKVMTPFSNQELQLHRGDTFYLMTDGLKDLFNEAGQKFTLNRLKDMLVQMNSLPLSEQKQRLEDEVVAFRGNRKQIDDITLLGFRV